MVLTGKTRLHSMESRSAFECSSSRARSRSCGYSSKNPGPPEGGVPARCGPESASSDGVVTHAYQSEARSSHCSAGSVGQPISTWNPAMAVPKRKLEEKERSSPREQAQTSSRGSRRFMRAAYCALLLGGIGCQAKLKLEHVGLVQF